MTRAEIIDHYLQKATERNFDISIIRKELEQAGVEDEEIKTIVRIVDNELQRNAIVGERETQLAHLTAVGAVVMIIGAAVTILTYTGVLGDGTSYFFAYGPLLGGLCYSCLVWQRSNQNRKSDPQSFD